MKEKILLVITVLFAFGLCSKLNQMPKDNSLIENFNTNRKSFDFLIEEFKKCGVDIVRKDTKVFSDEAVNAKFHTTMNELKIKQIHYRGLDNPSIELTVFSSGLATGGSGKGYTYIKDKKSRDSVEKYFLVENLDAYYKNNRNFFVYRKLDQYWYLFCDHDG